MATPYQINVPASDTGLLKVHQQDETAKKLSSLLQEDLETHHVFFNQEGFHNHIPHHILSLFGTGASTSTIQASYDQNNNYQLPAQKIHPGVADALAKDWASTAPKNLGNGSRYADFLLFFQQEIERAASHPDVRSGKLSAHEAVLDEFLFRGDPRAEDMLQRMFAGFLHPIIQLMFGVEWSQPAIVAEALAQAAVHKNNLKDFLEDAEARSKKSPPKESPSLAELYERIGASDKLRKAPRMSDANKIHDGILVRAPEEMLEIVSQVNVREDEVDEKTAEMFELAVWMAAGAALRPGKMAKWDFFLMHHINSAPIFLSFNQMSWLSAANKARILEWKIRMDLVQYAARGTPDIRFDLVEKYTPQDARNGKSLVRKHQDLLSRFHTLHGDDGHTIKLVRALSICEELVQKYNDKSWRKITSPETWLKMHYMVLDGAEDNTATWVRSAGFDEAWKDVPSPRLA